MSTLLRVVLSPSVDESPAEEAPNHRPMHFSEPFTRFGTQHSSTVSWPEESLVIDSRAELTPAQMVEQKLVSLLRGKAVPVSHMQMMNSLRQR